MANFPAGLLLVDEVIFMHQRAAGQCVASATHRTTSQGAGVIGRTIDSILVDPS